MVTDMYKYEVREEHETIEHLHQRPMGANPVARCCSPCLSDWLSTAQASGRPPGAQPRMARVTTVVQFLVGFFYTLRFFSSFVARHQKPTI